MSTVQPIFKIERKRAAKDHERILALGFDLPNIVATLKNQSKFDSLAIEGRRNALFTGGLLLLMALVSLTIEPRLGYVVLLFIPFAAWQFFKAQRQLKESKARWQDANDQMISLEGAQGFLWRFEHLLEDWGLDLDESDRDTLQPLCWASKNRTLADEDGLDQYWRWILLLEGRLRVLLENTSAADPLDIVDELIVVASQKYKETNRKAPLPKRQ